MPQTGLSSRFRVASTLFFIAGCSLLVAQTDTGARLLTPYKNCQFADGLQIAHIDQLAPGVTSREVETDSGSRQIDLRTGLRIMFAYPDTDFYANVKAELLPTANYPALKEALLGNFHFLAHGNTVNTALHSPLNGFDVHGLDREKLEGGVLGVYLLFDDPAHVVTTIYFLNQEPQSRRFQTIQEYRNLRDHFLSSYTGCIRQNQQHTD